MSANREFDLVVVGGGPGGYVAAIRAAQIGMKAALVEEKHLGGVCLNWGCIPTKALLKSAELYNELNRAGDWGLSLENPGFDIREIVKRSRRVASRLSKGVGFLMKKNGIEVFNDYGALDADANVLLTGGDTIIGKNVLLATGGYPLSLPGVEIDGEKIITSGNAMTLEELPSKMAIVGAGAIGVEFAYYLATFGVEVTLIEMMPHILPLEDEEIVGVLTKSLSSLGVDVMTNASVSEIDTSGNGISVDVKIDASSKTVATDVALMAVGVGGNVEGLGLEEAGIEVERGFIGVDELYRTNRPGVYAIGDVIGPPLLAHAASGEGICAVEVMAGIREKGVEYSNIPACTYCQPQVASLGLTETAAVENGLNVKVGRFPFRANGRALASGDYDGLVKLVFGEEYGELLGAHIVGSGATELIAELALAKSHEATYKSIIETVHAHPTLSEAVAEAAGDAFGEAFHI